MHRKTVLCDVACSPWMKLSHDDYVGACTGARHWAHVCSSSAPAVTNHQPPSPRPQWGVSAATIAPAIVRCTVPCVRSALCGVGSEAVGIQTGRAYVPHARLKLVDDVLDMITHDRNRAAWASSVAKVLDALHPNRHSSLSLRVKVVAHPKSAWGLICRRRDELGYEPLQPDVLALADSVGRDGSQTPAAAVTHLLQQVCTAHVPCGMGCHLNVSR